MGLALGPPYGLWQFVYWLPGFNMVRGSSRFMLVGLLGIAVLAGIGFDRISGRLARRRRMVLATVFGVLLVAEYAADADGISAGQARDPCHRSLARQPAEAVRRGRSPGHDIADIGAFERQETAYMLHSTAHFQKTVHGYSGWRTLFHMELFKEMEFFPDETSIASLEQSWRDLRRRAPGLLPPWRFAPVEDRLRRFCVAAAARTRGGHGTRLLSYPSGRASIGARTSRRARSRRA